MNRSEMRGLVGRAHGEFVTIGLAEEHCTVAPKLRCHRRLVGGHEVVEDMRARCRADASRAKQVFDGKRDTLKRPCLARSDTGIRCLRHGGGAFGSLQYKCIERTR